MKQAAEEPTTGRDQASKILAKKQILPDQYVSPFLPNRLWPCGERRDRAYLRDQLWVRSFRCPVWVDSVEKLDSRSKLIEGVNWGVMVC